MPVLTNDAAAKELACKALVKNYRHENATVIEMRDYAKCINTIYTQPMSAGETVLMKLAVVLVLACTAFGAWYDHRNKFSHENAFVNVLLGGMMGFAIGSAAAMVFGLLIVGVVAVFT